MTKHLHFNLYDFWFLNIYILFWEKVILPVLPFFIFYMITILSENNDMFFLQFAISFLFNMFEYFITFLINHTNMAC